MWILSLNWNDPMKTIRSWRSLWMDHFSILARQHNVVIISDKANNLQGPKCVCPNTWSCKRNSEANGLSCMIFRYHCDDWRTELNFPTSTPPSSPHRWQRTCPSVSTASWTVWRRRGVVLSRRMRSWGSACRIWRSLNRSCSRRLTR